MASHAPAIHAEDHHALGQKNRLTAFWVFLGSECLFFGSLISTYMSMRGRATAGPNPVDVFDIPFTSVSTFVLLFSSLMMVMAVYSIRNGDVRGLKTWLLATAFGGMIFLAGQVYEFTTFYQHGLTLGTSIFGSSFFVLTGFHGAHVTLGVMWLLSLYVQATRGKIQQANFLDVEIAGLYWHFVDVVWIIIFTVVYLLHF